MDQLYFYRYRRYRYDIVLYLLDQLFTVDIVDIVSWLSDHLYCGWYRVYIDTISFRDCWLSCIAVDVVDIDTISIKYRHAPGGSTVLPSISSISSISIQRIQYRFMIVGSPFFLSISMRYRHVLIGSTVLLSISSIWSISIRYRHDIVSWLSDQMFCCRYQYDVDTISSSSCLINCIVALITE